MSSTDLSRSLGVGELFQLFRDGRPRTKGELAMDTGLARSTLSLRTDALLNLGLLRPSGAVRSSGGRPPTALAFDPGARVVIGCDLGATHGVVALADLTGTVLKSASGTVDIAAGPEAVLAWVARTARTLLAETNQLESQIAGVGIGVPGPVEHSTGRAVKPPIMPGWDGFDIPAYISHSLAGPVFVDNDVNLLALGERKISLPHIDDLIFVKVSTGIGAGIITGGVLQRGSEGAAGDIGHVFVPHPPGAARALDDERDLEAIASGPAIAAALRARGISAETGADVVDLLRMGSREARDAARQAGREIGAVLATVVNLLNPSVVVVGGSVAQAGQDLLAGIREVVYRRSMPLATQNLLIVPSKGGETAGVVGAATMVIESVLSPAAIDGLTSERQ